MQLFEMQGLLAGKCLPGDMKVNESLAEYLLRKLEDRNELERQLSAKTISEQNIINAFGIKGEGAHSKLVIEYVHGLVAENARMREAIEFATAPDMWQEQHDGMLDYRYVDWYVDVLNAALEPKSTDAAIAEIEAKAIERFVSKLAYGLRTAGGGDGYHSNPYHECADFIELKGGDYVEALQAGDNP